MRKSLFLLITVSLAGIGLWACGTANNSNNSDVEAPASDNAAPEPVDPAPEPAAEPAAAPASVDAASAKSGGPCESDADCVKATCCHAATCVDKSQAPACDGMMCTRDCVPETMDCGRGKCVCQEGQCSAQIEAGPAASGATPE